MYDNLGEFDHIATLNPLGTTSYLHFNQAYIKGNDFDGCNIIIKYPMLNLLDFKSQNELKMWISNTLSKPISVYVTKEKFAYITQPPERPIFNIIPWIIIGLYVFFYGTYNIYRIYIWIYPRNNYTSITNNNIDIN
jgi:hypothetical protein